MKSRLFTLLIALFVIFKVSATDIPKNWLKGAQEGDTSCVHLIAHHYAYDQNHGSKALQWLRKSIDLKGTGGLDSQTTLAGYYWDGLGVKKDQNQALVLLKEAAEEGYPYAALALGYIYKNYLHEDGEAIKCLYKAHIMATEQDYFDFGLENLYRGHGWTFLTKKDREDGVTFIRAYTLLEEIAHNHNKLAYRYLGDIFLRYMPVHNFKQGILYYEQAALLGDEESKPFVGITTGQDGNTGYAEIGKVFYEGIGTTPQPERAVEYFEIGTKYHNFKSIDESNCYFYLGLSYYEGKGNEQDYRKAWGNFICATGWDHKKWPTIEDALKDPEYKKTYHNTEAMRYLSRCYRFGRGCEKDLKQAEDLLALAALTDEEMKKLLEETMSNNP